MLAPGAAKWKWGPRVSPAQRATWGKEEQGSERSFCCQAEMELSGLCSDVAGMAGLEPADEGVKVPCLTTWLHPYVMSRSALRGKTQAGAATPACRLDVGWVKGLEPSTPGTTIRCSNQLSYTHHIH